MGRGTRWFEERLPLGRAVRTFVTEKIPGGSSFAFVLGSATAIDFLILAATGVWQLFYYVPTTDHAYDSVNFLRFQVPFGWLVHGLHYWAASAMVVLALLHLGQVLAWGAFKRPRELTWLLGVVLLLTTLAAMFTGTPLPWDKRGYLAAQVASGIANSVPVLGGFLKRAFFGGETVGQLALSRFFAGHVAIVPLLLGAVILVHLASFRSTGAAGPFSEKRRSAREGDFWPDQVLKDFIFMALVFVGIVGLTAWLKTPVYGAADPTDSLYVGRPEWPFLFLFQLLTFLPGRLEVVGALVVPLILVVLLAAVPWLDRTPEREPRRRLVPLALFALVVLVLAGLGVAGARQPTEIVMKAPPTPSVASVVPTAPANPTPGRAASIVGNAEHGRTLFVAFCESCHGPEGKRGVPNPGSDDKEVPGVNPIDPSQKSKDPQAFAENLDFFLQYGSMPSGPRPKLNMPAFGVTNGMTQPGIADTEAYVEQLNGVDRARIARPGVDPKAFWWVTLLAFAAADALGLVLLARRR
ncbi:MAG TPA: cytochrome b N-terminal domain-containing protein [Coriobacteriia bacterium]|jgi:ubiquinol-cytochrome c reductase cytochrome b subunit